MKQTDRNIQTPEASKLIGLRECFSTIGPKKYAALVFVVSCLLRSRTCNLYLAADYADNGLSFRGNYGRIIRFFATGLGECLLRGVFNSVLLLAHRSGSAKCLVIDRTEWQSGSRWRNLLVIGLSVHGCVIPLVWADIAHRGISNNDLRIMLLQRLKDWWPTDQLALTTYPLVGDREFGGENFLLKIAQMGFKFVARIKSNRLLNVWKNAKWMDKAYRPRVLRRFLERNGDDSLEIVIAGEYLCFLSCISNSGTRDKDLYIYLLTNLEHGAEASSFYAHRWQIESCFGHLKTNGFDLENQGFVNQHQVEILFAIIVLIYAIATSWGILTELKDKDHKPKNKKYANGKQYRPKSLFRTGCLIAYSQLSHLNFNPTKIFNELIYCLSEVYTSTKLTV